MRSAGLDMVRRDGHPAHLSLSLAMPEPPLGPGKVGPNTSLEACSGEDYLRSGAYAFPPRMPSLPHFRWPSNASVVANWTGHSSGDFVDSGE